MLEHFFALVATFAKHNSPETPLTRMVNSNKWTVRPLEVCQLRTPRPPRALYLLDELKAHDRGRRSRRQGALRRLAQRPINRAGRLPLLCAEASRGIRLMLSSGARRGRRFTTGAAVELLWEEWQAHPPRRAAAGIAAFGSWAALCFSSGRRIRIRLVRTGRRATTWSGSGCQSCNQVMDRWCALR